MRRAVSSPRNTITLTAVRATLRRNDAGAFQEMPTEQAMDEVADALERIIDEYGPRSVALYNGTKSRSNVSFSLGRSWLTGIGSSSFYTTVTVDQPAKTMASSLHGRWLGGFHRIQRGRRHAVRRRQPAAVVLEREREPAVRQHPRLPA